MNISLSSDNQRTQTVSFRSCDTTLSKTQITDEKVVPELTPTTV